MHQALKLDLREARGQQDRLGGPCRVVLWRDAVRGARWGLDLSEIFGLLSSLLNDMS